MSGHPAAGRPRRLLGYYALFAALALPVALAAGAYAAHEAASRRPADAVSQPVAPPQGSSEVPIAEVFNGIYAHAGWGENEAGVPSSGSGSTLDATAVYRAFLQQFMKDHHIHSVVDAGCGDWEFSRAIDWTGIDYKGYDVVASVVQADQARYGARNVSFFVANVVDDELPPADLLIVKHVLQHLTNSDVLKFMKQLPKFKHVLLTDGVDPRTFSSDNPDIARGQYRMLDPTRPPFNVPGAKILTWWDGYDMHQVVYVRGTR